MKRIIAILTTVACIGVLAAGCACNSKKEDETTAQKQEGSISVVPANSTTAKAKQKETVIVTAVPSKKAKTETTKPGPKKTKAKGGNIVGSWTFEGGIFVYVFKKDGSGVYTTGSDAMYFTYKTANNKVIITYKDGTKVTMPYTVKGKTLYLKDENGDDMPYYKNKPHKNPNK